MQTRSVAFVLIGSLPGEGHAGRQVGEHLVEPNDVLLGGARPGGAHGGSFGDVGSAVRLRIRDSGPGIAPQALDRIFKPFFTTRSQGTGLGLAIVRNIVLAHGGSVEAANPEGGGAEFTITLPRDAR